jgi:hypothetical protein
MGGRVFANLRRALDLRAMSFDERLEFALLVGCILVGLACELYASAHGMAEPYRNFADAHGVPGSYEELRSGFRLLTICGAAIFVVLLADGPVQLASILGGMAAAEIVAPGFLAESAAALLVQLGWALFGGAERARQRFFVLYRILLFVIPTALAPFLLDLIGRSPATYDPQMLDFDNALGIRIPSLVAKFVTLPGVSYPVFLVYTSTVAGLALHEALRRRAGRSGSMTTLFIAGAVLAWFAFKIFPVAGPPYYVPDYYASLWPNAGAVTTPAIDPAIYRNCMPSMHAAWAYILFVKAREHPQRWLRWCFCAYATIMILGALTNGRHWFIDIVVAMPFAVAILAVAEQDLAAGIALRIKIALAGLSLTAAWLLLFLWRPALSPPAAWTLVIATALFSAGLYRQLRGLPWAVPPALRRNEALH